MSAAIYARLNTKAVDRALQTQTDRFCSLVSGGMEVLPALEPPAQLTVRP
jgi:hypothetical protein